jgi:hypothetical protein
MPSRGSLKKCIQLAVASFREGYADTVVITGNRAAKYYSFWFRAEFDGKCACTPTFRPRIVLCCTGGELASIIATTQLELGLTPTLDDPERGSEDEASQTDPLEENTDNGDPATLDERQQPGNDPAS